MTALLTFISKSLVLDHVHSTWAIFVLFFHFNLPNRLSLYRDTHSKVFISDPGQHFLSFQLAAPPIFPTTSTPGAAETYAETMAPTIKNSSPPTSSSSNDEVLEKKERRKSFLR